MSGGAEPAGSMNCMRNRWIIGIAVSLWAVAQAQGAELVLRVVDASNDDPVFQAKVRARVDGKLLGAVTDTAGECAIPFPEAGVSRLSITVSARDFVPMILEWRGGGSPPAEHTVKLEPGTVIGGTIEDTAGQPIEGAEVRIYVQPPSDPDRSGPFEQYFAITDHLVTADAEGRWQCDIVPADAAKVRLRLQLPGHTYYRTITYSASGEHLLESLRSLEDVITLERRFAATGTVLDPEGQPVPNAHVVIWTVDAQPDRGFISQTKGDGTFAAKNCKPGQAVVVVHAEGCALHMFRPDLALDMAPMTINLEPGRTLLGRVVDSNDAPVPGANVTLTGWRGYGLSVWKTQADDEGRFVWTSAPEDGVDFQIDKEGYLGPEVRVLTASDEEHKIVLGYILQLTGMVTDAETNEPLPEFTVVRGIDWEGSGALEWLSQDTVQGKDGEYVMTFDDSYPAYGVRVEAPGYLPSVSPLFEGRQGQQVFDAALRKGKGLKGVVRTASGEPVARADVVAATESQAVVIRNGSVHNRGEAAIVRSDAEGRFEFPPQAEPVAIVVLGDDGSVEAVRPFDESEIELVLEPWGIVEGTARKGEKPAQNATIVLRYERPPNAAGRQVTVVYRAVADAEGFYFFDDVPADEARVAREVQFRDGSVAETNAALVTVVSNETVTVDLGGAGRPVVGQPTLAGQPISEDAAMNGTLRSSPTPIPFPEGLSGDEKEAWHVEWFRSGEGRTYREAQRSYVLEPAADTGFRIEDVLPGDYVLEMTVKPEDRDPDTAPSHVSLNVTVPESPGSEPFDLGEIEMPRVGPLAEGDVVPNFSVNTLDGKTITLWEHRGKYVLLDFWASWCAPCGREAPFLRAVHDEFGADSRFLMIGLDLDEDIETAKGYVERNQMPWPQGFLGDWPSTSVPDDFGVKAIPAIMLIDPEGRLVARNLRGDEIAKAVRAALE